MHLNRLKLAIKYKQKRVSRIKLSVFSLILTLLSLLLTQTYNSSWPLFGMKDSQDSDKRI